MNVFADHFLHSATLELGQFSGAGQHPPSPPYLYPPTV